MASIDHYELPLPKVPKGTKLLIVCSPYYKQIADNLRAGAEAVIAECGAESAVLEVPGALEIPTAIAMAAATKQYDGFVALGCIIRGETSHYDTVCNESARGLTEIGLKGVPVGNGILTVENTDQAIVRADPQGQNKGGGAAAAALHLIVLEGKLTPKKSFGFAPDSEHIQIAGK